LTSGVAGGTAPVRLGRRIGLDHSFVQLPVFDARGGLLHRRGVTASPGLYFLGLPWQYTRDSALLGWIKDDAE
jgi:putative flavoprotein involved in K+ transport